MENPEPANIREIVQQHWLPNGIVIDILKENLVKKVIIFTGFTLIKSWNLK